MWKKNKNLHSLQKFNCWYNLWAIDYREGENKEETIRVTLKKLFFYLIFLSIGTTVILKMVHPLAYTFTTVVQAQFVDTDFSSSGRKGPITFKDIRNHADFWTYLIDVAISNMDSAWWYSRYSPLKQTTKDDNKFLFENSLLGVPRFRDLKINEKKCDTYENLIEPFFECYGLYSENSLCKENFKQEEITDPFYKNLTCLQYTEPKTSFKYYGSVSTYHSGGYIQNLDKNMEKSLAIITYLFNNWYISRATRVVFLEFTFYNANLNLFCICKLVFEIPPSGGFVTSSSFQTIKLMRYKDPDDFVIMGLEFVYICYIIFFICQEIRNMKYYKWRYFKFFWTYVNLFIIICSFILIPFNAYKFFIIPKKIKELDANPNQFADMDYIVFWQSFINITEALLLFIMWIKLFRFLNLSKTMGQLGLTLNCCLKDMLVFSNMFFIVFFGFAQMGYLLFGEQIDRFSTFGKSLMTLLLTILGDFDYYAIEKHNKILAPIFFTTFIFLVFFILFNMFLAIITDTFFHVKNEIKAKRSELEISEFLSRLPTNVALLICPQCVTRKKRKLKLSGNEMISKLRRILELCNFSNFEIKLFFQMYFINENKAIDDQLVLNMLENIKKYELKSEEDRIKPEDKLSIESFLRQQERIEYIKAHIASIDEKLNQFAVAYRQSQK